jgi:hypothetical protein
MGIRSLVLQDDAAIEQPVPEQGRHRRLAIPLEAAMDRQKIEDPGRRGGLLKGRQAADASVIFHLVVKISGPPPF